MRQIASDSFERDVGRGFEDEMQALERLPIQVTSDRHTERELATLLTEADRMVPPELIVNDR